MKNIPAFPYDCDPEHCSHDDCKGMTLRDYFAAKAMQSLASNYLANDSWGVRHISESAYELADAMLAQRDK